MKRSLRYLSWAVAIGVGCGVAQQASAAIVATGTFTQDDQVYTHAFNVPANTNPTTNVVLRTSSYAAGGFDPVLTLFDGTDLKIDENDDGPDGRDSFLSVALAAGNYTVR
jgi:hypothetical protein